MIELGADILGYEEMKSHLFTDKFDRFPKLVLEKVARCFRDDADKYVPYRTGETSKSAYRDSVSDVMNGVVGWDGIDEKGNGYADIIYGSNRAFSPKVHPLATGHWIEETLEDWDAGDKTEEILQDCVDEVALEQKYEFY